MKATGPKEERETIIRFDDEAVSASIWTASDVVYRRLIKQLGTGYLLEEGERHAVFELPKSWIKLPRKRKERSPRQIEAAKRLGASKTRG